MIIDQEIREVAQVIWENLPDGPVNVNDAVFVERLFRNTAALKMNFWLHHPAWVAVRDNPAFKPGTEILDFGCGAGHMGIILACGGYHVHGVDLSRVAIAIANNMRTKAEAVIPGRVRFTQLDITTAPPDKEYPAVWAAHVFEHIADPAPVLAGLTRWMAPRAPMLIEVPLGRAFDDPGHVHHFFTEQDITNYLGEYARMIAHVDLVPQHRVIRILLRRDK